MSKKKKVFNLIGFLLIVLANCSCWPGNNHKQTVQLCKYPRFATKDCRLYLQYYLSYSGFLATDVNNVFLTDSATFRIFLGRYSEEDEQIDCKFNGDNVAVSLLSRDGIDPNWAPWRVLKKKSYNIKELIIRHIVE